MINRSLLAASLALAALAPATARAQQLFPGFLVPGFRNGADPRSEFSKWDVFSEPYNAPNDGDVAHSVSNPSLTQTLDPNAFLTSGFNIYDFSAATGYTVADTIVGQPLTSVVFQFDTLGTLIDFNSIRLHYSGSGGDAPLNFISESRLASSSFGGLDNRIAAQWDLTGKNVTAFTITFQALGSSNSLNLASLDTFTGAFTEVTPSARTWTNGAADGKWDTASNWSGGALPSVGGNVTFGPGSGSGVALGSTDREVGDLHLTQGGGFAISCTGTATLKVNTGITADVAGAGAYTVSVPVFLGGHGLMNVAAGNTLTISGEVSGAPAIAAGPGTSAYPAAGLLKSGDGILTLSANNTFLGSVGVEGGRLILAGVNQYTGVTGVSQGELNVRANAPSGAPGALGNSTGNVTVGADPSTNGALAEAAIAIEGNYEVARTISVSTGANPKALVVRNAASAVYSGNVSLGGTSSNLSLRAEGAADSVSFTGQITGGAAANPIAKTGLGTVIFSGVDKTYSSATTVSAGTLRLAAGTALTGSGAVTVAGGATLAVDGTLGGDPGAALTVNGTLSGGGTVNRIFSLATGAVISPGAGVGRINTLDQTWAGGGAFKVEFSSATGAAGAGHDLVSLTGGLNLSATSANPFILQLQTLAPGGAAGALTDFNRNTPYSWPIASASGGVAGFAGASQFLVNAAGFAGADGTFRVSQNGNDLLLQYSPVPEPSAWAMLLTGATAVTGWAIRRRRAG